MKNMKTNQWGKMKIAKIFALVVLLLSFGGNSIAADYVGLKIYPEDVGVFTEDGKQQFVAFGVNANGSTVNITSDVDWKSSNKSLVTINKTGLASIAGGVTSGQVKISCSYPKQIAGLTGVNLLLLKETFLLRYTAGSHGSISGTLLQEVDLRKDGTIVTAVPDTHYHFDQWDDGLTTAARTDRSVTQNISVTALFAIDTYTLTYEQTTNCGGISGDTTQVIAHGSDASQVTVADGAAATFTTWTDGVTTRARTDTNITETKTYTAVCIDNF